MRRRTKRRLFTGGLMLGLIWNILCLTAAVSAALWPASLTPVGLGTIGVLLPMVAPALFSKDEKAAALAEQGFGERLAAGLVVCLALGWMVTLAACIAASH